MHLDVWADISCPWCRLGRRRLELALEHVPWADEVVVRYRSFQLDPDLPGEPQPLKDGLRRKFGAQKVDGMLARHDDLGAEVGLRYDWDRALRVNTGDAHRLLRWAWETAGSAPQGSLFGRLQSAFFNEGSDVADHDVLVRAAGHVGLDIDEARSVIVSDRYSEEVIDDQRAAAGVGVTGVPAIAHAGQLIATGAAGTEELRALLEGLRSSGHQAPR
jgi:predicted DsbA family dithiol-disulfide isomerase